MHLGDEESRLLLPADHFSRIMGDVLGGDGPSTWALWWKDESRGRELPPLVVQARLSGLGDDDADGDAEGDDKEYLMSIWKDDAKKFDSRVRWNSMGAGLGSLTRKIAVSQTKEEMRLKEEKRLAKLAKAKAEAKALAQAQAAGTSTETPATAAVTTSTAEATTAGVDPATQGQGSSTDAAKPKSSLWAAATASAAPTPAPVPETEDPENKSRLARRAVIWCDAFRRILVLENFLNGFFLSNSQIITLFRSETRVKGHSPPVYNEEASPNLSTETCPTFTAKAVQYRHLSLKTQKQLRQVQLTTFHDPRLKCFPAQDFIRAELACKLRPRAQTCCTDDQFKRLLQNALDASEVKEVQQRLGLFREHIYTAGGGRVEVQSR